ncbi:MAG: sensor domain-containing diguanylate cyclase [Gammaproteobacteria bacterium]|nr:sensor domain-containing diguanylate cyclase [Gammaproteobacteria bacterium]MDH3446934.1 sensor domain-containing diguanylate cyclase [Gammaproteobacteria bacterium]
MKTPDNPANEKERLKELRSLDILDTSPEERFDRLTRMAKRVFGVDIALVSLVDENRQWFKSRAGLDACETGRDISFCGHAILGSEIFIIEDALQDERFHDNPLVTGPPNIRFYAGAPLRYMNGNKLGTLCIVDSKPRTLDVADLEMLRDLAEMAESELNAVQLATIDDLTKISNRRGFVALAQNSISLCARQGVPVSLVFLDLDKFKPINDNYGHAEGDHALVTFASLMRQTFRESDVFARIGGDEFVVLLTNTTEKYANEIVARFRGLVEIYNAEANRGYDIAFSDGIVCMQPGAESTIDELLDEADVLMYEKKLDKAPRLDRVKQA